MTSLNALLRLAKTNLALLFNAGSLVGSTAVTSLLGFAYWWVATRLYTPGAIGLASALISAMTLLGTVSMLGLGTLLTGELPRQPGKEWPLINAALIIVGGAGLVAGIVFALIAPFLSPDFSLFRANIINIVLFACGVSFTALTMVLDQALIGILRGDLQFWRNTLFAATKLVTLFVTGFFLPPGAGMIIYATWFIGNAFSLVVVFFGQKPGAAGREIPGKEALSGPPMSIEKSIELPCPDCGTLSPNGARFCSSCGYPFSPTVEMASVRPQLFFDYGVLGPLEAPGNSRRNNSSHSSHSSNNSHYLCPRCGNTSPDMARFCVSCGYPLTPTMKTASAKINQSHLAIELADTLPLVAVSKQGNALRSTGRENAQFFPVTDKDTSNTVISTPLPGKAEQPLLLAEPANALLPAAKEDAPSAPEQNEKNSSLLQWDVLRTLGGAALQHHILNLILLVPPLVLPILVTVQLSATENAWFYLSFMLANFVFSLTYALSTVLYAISSAQPSVLTQKIRFTLGLSFITGLGANIILQAGAGLLLGIFGHAYTEQAAWCLRILSIAVFPLIIISHYIAICRIQNRIISVILPIAVGAIIELAGAAIGAHLSGLAGLSLGWLTGLVLESLYMTRTVYKAARPMQVNPMAGEKQDNRIY